MARIKPPSWTAAEDARFIAVLEEQILKKGKKLDEVYPIIAEELGRPEGGCKYRYTTVLKARLSGTLKDKLAGKVVINTRSNLIERILQTDKELSKVDRHLDKASKNVEQLKARKIELGENMKRYSDLLVQSSMEVSE